MISTRYRNAATRAREIKGWMGNMAQKRQRSVIQMDTTLRLAKRYREKPRPGTGQQIQYDINVHRAEPQKLEKWYAEEKQKNNKTKNGKV